MEAMNRRVGYRFRPSREILLKILQFAVQGGDVSLCSDDPGNITVCDLFGEDKEPWKVFSSSHDEWQLHDVRDYKVKEKFIVTKLPADSSRAAGAGCWEGSETEYPVMSGGHVIGYWMIKTYVYCGDPADAADKHFCWMNEYHLSGHSLQQIGISNTDYLLCQIIRDESRDCLVRNDGATTSIITG